MRVVITEFMDEEALEGFGPSFDVEYDPALVEDREALLEKVSDADALIVRHRTRVDHELLEAAPSLKVVGRLGVGVDNINLEACGFRKVDVCPATGANTTSVVEYVLTAALMLVRGAYRTNHRMVAGEWPRNELIGGEVSGRLLGLYGFGGISRAVAEKARALGMKIAAYDPFVPDDDPAWKNVIRLSKEDLLARADVLSLHVPATPQTYMLMNSETLALMKSDAVLINTARGTIVDYRALCEQLKKGRLGGAALDVFWEEPLTAEAAETFMNVPNLLLTPHIAGVTEEGTRRVSSVTVENVKRALLKA
ncbi:MAG: hydroxyacid dehydrogenase [Pseudomonadota bacterium]